MPQFIERLRDEGVSSIYGMPFLYYPTFWSGNIQEAIKIDIKYSDRMDAVIMSGYTLFEQWQSALQSRIKMHRSIRFMLPDPDSEVFLAVQKAWGLAGKLEARRDRVATAKKNLEDLFTGELPNLTDEEKKKIHWRVQYYDQCPFYSFYLFDDKVYLAQYPFLRPGKLASPVYVFFRSSPEYERVDREWRGLQALNTQTSRSG